MKNSKTPLISIITVVYNNEKDIRNAIESVLDQNYEYIEYIVIDGGSDDGTIDVINEYRDHISVFISETDNGIYDALNKGVLCASGDVVAILHSDDQFCNSRVVSNMMEKIEQTKVEFCFSNMVLVDKPSGKILRYYMASYFKIWMFKIGWMPPHPTCFIKRSLFDEFGMYSTDYKIAGDFDLLVRFFYGRKIRWSYLNQITVKMSTGGVSNSGWRSKKLVYSEISR
ncbi:MAG: glycosyltransferase, partial [Candidatus Marinimicrobia bacterium]|nr:glycosyltransferase [Candidatus Neomarinimicrobiota bacterium]